MFGAEGEVEPVLDAEHLGFGQAWIEPHSRYGQEFKSSRYKVRHVVMMPDSRFESAALRVATSPGSAGMRRSLAGGCVSSSGSCGFCRWVAAGGRRWFIDPVIGARPKQAYGLTGPVSVTPYATETVAHTTR